MDWLTRPWIILSCGQCNRIDLLFPVLLLKAKLWNSDAAGSLAHFALYAFYSHLSMHQHGMVAKTFNYLSPYVISLKAHAARDAGLLLSPQSCQSKLLCWIFSRQPCSLLAFRSCVRAPSWASPNQLRRLISHKDERQTVLFYCFFIFLNHADASPNLHPQDLPWQAMSEKSCSWELFPLNFMYPLSLSRTHTHFTPQRTIPTRL